MFNFPIRYIFFWLVCYQWPNYLTKCQSEIRIFLSNKKHLGDSKTNFLFCEQSPLELCMCSIKIFTLFFSDLSRSRRKKQLDLKIVPAVTNIVVFIALFTVLGLYIKGYAQFNLISRNIMVTLKGCTVLVEIYFAWNNKKGSNLNSQEYPET